MSHIHQRKIAHRDLKLPNILVDKDFSLRIIDYGLSISFEKLLDPTVPKKASGTPEYKPPEVDSRLPI